MTPGDAPDIPTELTIGFEGGVPVSLDGETLGPVDLVQRVHDLGGKHGIGRIDHVEHRLELAEGASNTVNFPTLNRVKEKNTLTLN